MRKFSIIKKQKEYYLKNKDKIKARSRAWTLNNPEKARINGRKGGAKYQKTPKGYFKAILGRTKYIGKPIEITQEQFLEWHNNQPKFCHYCRTPEDRLYLRRSNKVIKRLTIDRKDNSLGYTLSNICLACMLCNSIKSNVFTEEEMFKFAPIIREKNETLFNNSSNI